MRFKDSGEDEIGPGAYEIQPLKEKQGGFIPKKER